MDERFISPAGCDYDLLAAPTRVPIKCWTRAVPVEDVALAQLANVAAMPFVHGHLAVMPDVHLGMGATIGSVIPTAGAIMPAAVGVDIGCGMRAVELDIQNEQLAAVDLARLRHSIEEAIPHGRTDNGGVNDSGAWKYRQEPSRVRDVWQAELREGYEGVIALAPKLAKSNARRHLGTLGSGNHFIEVCSSDAGTVWVVVHSGSRGIGGAIGSYYLRQAKALCKRWRIALPDPNLAYLPEGEPKFDAYLAAAQWAQKFAQSNRQRMSERCVQLLKDLWPSCMTGSVIDCHHNFVERTWHRGKSLWLTRKGATDASRATWGVIPGSMGTPTYIVQGKGRADSWNSCSHGAGRAMSRTEARKRFSVADHAAATEGVECRKDTDVLDETPGSYKDIEVVMAAQSGLVDVVHTLKQVLCVKG